MPSRNFGSIDTTYWQASARNPRRADNEMESEDMKNEVSTDEQSRHRRAANFATRVEPMREPDFDGEKSLVVTYNGRQEYRTPLSPAEAQKVFDVLGREFNLNMVQGRALLARDLVATGYKAVPRLPSSDQLRAAEKHGVSAELAKSIYLEMLAASPGV
jgi:hypothetical protein